MAYYHKQKTCLCKYFAIVGIICLIGLISGFIVSIALNQAYNMGSYTGCVFGIVLLCICQRYKYLIIEEVNNDSINIGFEIPLRHQCGRNKTYNIEFNNIRSFKKTSSKIGCNPIGISSCGVVMILNGNGCGPSCQCCCKECSNLDMIELELIEAIIVNGCNRYDGSCMCCDNAVVKIRASTDDINNLIDLLVSKNVQRKSNSYGTYKTVNLRIESQNDKTYKSIDNSTKY